MPEGYEYQALMGVKETLGKTKHVIMEASENLEKIQRILRDAEHQIQKLKFTSYICF